MLLHGGSFLLFRNGMLCFIFLLLLPVESSHCLHNDGSSALPPHPTMTSHDSNGKHHHLSTTSTIRASSSSEDTFQSSSHHNMTKRENDNKDTSIVSVSSQPTATTTRRLTHKVGHAWNTVRQSILGRNRNHRSSSLMMTRSFTFLSGMSEAICFRRFKCFPNMMTGNTVRCMDALADQKWDLFGLYVSMIGMYVLGGSLFSLLDETSCRMTLESSSMSTSRRNDSSTTKVEKSRSTRPIHIWIPHVALGLFLCSDGIGRYVHNLARLPVMALTYGMLNAAATDMLGGTVTNAVTGHWTKLGVGMGKRGRNNNNSSLQAVGCFVLGLITTDLIHNWIRQYHHQVLSYMPPLGLSFGLLYLGLFSWYRSSSKVDEQAAKMDRVE